MNDKINTKTSEPAADKSAAGSNNKMDKKSSQISGNAGGIKPAAGKKNSVSKKDKASFEKAEKSKRNTAASFEKFKKEYNIKKIAAALLVVVFVCISMAFAAVNLLDEKTVVPDYIKDIEFKGRVEPESIAFDMDISENQQKTLAKATKSKGNRRAFSFFVNDNIIMSEYDEPALIEFGSISSNDCVLIFFLFDEEGREIYRSLGIEPGKQVKSVMFFEEMSYGSHELTMAVMGYDAKTCKNTGMQTVKINLEIGVN